MKLRAILLTLCCSWLTQANAQTLQQVISKINSYKNISYTDTMKSQMSFDINPSADTLKSYITNIPAEPQLGGYYKTASNTELCFYDGHKGADLYYQDSTYRISDDAVMGQNSRTLLYYSHSLGKYLKTPSKIKQLADTTIGNIAYAHVLVSGFDSVQDGHHVYTHTYVVVNKKTLLPYSITDKIMGLGDDGSVGGWVEQHIYSDYKFDEKGFPDLSVITIPANFHPPVKSAPVAFLPNGTKAPDVTFYDLAGKPINLKTLQGKPLLVNFTWIGCPHCGGAAEMLNRLYDRYKNAGVTIISVYPLDDKAHVLKFEQKMDVKFRSFTADKNVKNTYPFQGYPSFYLLDKDGNIAQTYLGFYKELEGQLAEKIDGLGK